MPIIHSLIAVFLFAFFLSPVIAADPESCQEYQVPDSASSTDTITGNGWQLEKRDAYIGAKRVQLGTCTRITYTVADWTAARGCKVGLVIQKTNPQCSGDSANYPPEFSNCAAVGFSLIAREKNREPVILKKFIGYFSDEEMTSASRYPAAMDALAGVKVCYEGKRYQLEVGEYYSESTNDFIEINGVKKYRTFGKFNAVPLCEPCQGTDPGAGPDDGPPLDDADGDGDPNDTDPDADGDGNPDNPGDGSGDPGDGGDPGGGGDDGDPGDGGDPGDDGGTDPGDGGGDGDPPDDDDDGDSDGDGCPDSEEPCLPSGPGDGDGDGDPDSQCDPAKEDCSGTKPGSFGGNCMAGFTCQGDAIQCAIAREQYATNCKLFKEDDGTSVYGKAKAGTDGFDPAKMRETSEKIGVGTFNQSGFGWSRSCPADPSIPLSFAGGADLVIPFSRICGPLGLLSLAAVGLTLLASLVFVLGVKKG